MNITPDIHYTCGMNITPDIHYTCGMNITPDIHFRFIFDIKYKTIGMTFSLISEIDSFSFNCSGIFAGQLIRISSLNDLKEHIPKIIKYPTEFKASALLCGSAEPHIVTINGSKLSLMPGLYRLFQWNNSYGNIIINSRRQLAYLYIKIDKQEIVVTYKNNIMKIMDEKGKLILNRYEIKEINLTETTQRVTAPTAALGEVSGIGSSLNQTSDAILRIQGNGAISLACMNLESNIAGLFMGDILKLKFVKDGKKFKSKNEYSLEQITQKSPFISVSSMYENLIEPWIKK
jgi:hypothetical protein